MLSLERYLAGRYTAGTARNYAFEIGRYLKRCGGEEIAKQATYADLVRELETLRGHYPKPATVHRMLAAIKCYYRYLVATGQRADQPAHRLRLVDGLRRGGRSGQQQLQDLLTSEELQLLLQPRPERYANLAVRNRIIMGLLVHQALTAAEIAGLRTADIGLTQDPPRIEVWGRGGTVDRRLKLAAGQVMQLHTYLMRDRPRLLTEKVTDRLILTGRGTPERGEGIAYLVETLRPLLPGKRLTATTIRQSVIAGRLRAGEDLRKVQVFAGHRYISSTERYRETNLQELRQAVARFHPLDREAGGGNPVKD